ncbi:unnamed protein product [Ectocarpus sp. 4 AP-2014]|uniref:EsV-1-25 n=1 Tax=Ectocarpus siliculosus virus 1 (isolate New Zealand/Kaikoura/1988) TaxID=654926 RepID=Q8QNN6_ESV1K|nr:EsV-1-25 [Ectocarpus siliculosus virus 1]AAK14451.1 EsV-1-25 [Ectocarpus siliculosus virus 1]
MIRVRNLRHRSLVLSFDAVVGAVSFKLTVQKLGGVEKIVAEGTETQYAVDRLEPNTQHRLRVYARGAGSEKYELRFETLVTTPWANFDDLGPDELRHVSMFAGGFDTDHAALNEVACLPFPNQYRTLPDADGSCGPTAPTLDPSTGCCIGGADGHELSFLQALETAYDEVTDRHVVGGSVEYAVKWIRVNNKQSVGNFVQIGQQEPWKETFIKLLFAGGVRAPPNGFKVYYNGTCLVMLGKFWVQADDVEMRGWMSDTGVNGQLRVVVSAGMQQAVPYATRARDSHYCSSRVAGQELEYFDVTKLSTVLSSPDCGFKGQCFITFGAQPCAIDRQRYASAVGFLSDIMTAMVRNRDIYDCAVSLRHVREGGLHLPPATVAPLELIRDFGLGAVNNTDRCITIARKVLQSLRTTVNTLGVEPAPGTTIVRYTDRTSPNFDFQLSVRSEIVGPGVGRVVVRKSRCPISGTRFWTGTTRVEGGRARRLYNTRDLNT